MAHDSSLATTLLAFEYGTGPDKFHVVTIMVINFCINLQYTCSNVCRKSQNLFFEALVIAELLYANLGSKETSSRIDFFL